MASSTRQTIEILNNIVVYTNRYVGMILYIISNIGNLLSLMIFLKKSWRKNVCIFYFLNCILINLLYTNSTMLGTVLSFGFNINPADSNVIICKIHYYLSYLFATLSPNVFVCASIDRLLISSRY
ncbi:hypothetical protein I4U23_001352 [Adineta vaga]|nr:hypothetical protein I4U23_001352 [Adineta vaga]